MSTAWVKENQLNVHRVKISVIQGDSTIKGRVFASNKNKKLKSKYQVNGLLKSASFRLENLRILWT